MPASPPPRAAAPSDDSAASPADTAAAPGALASAGSSTGRIETSADRDGFAITLAARQHQTFDLRGAGTGGGTLADPMLALHDAAAGGGDRIHRRHDHLVQRRRAERRNDGLGTYTLRANTDVFS